MRYHRVDHAAIALAMQGTLRVPLESHVVPGEDDQGLVDGGTRSGTNWCRCRAGIASYQLNAARDHLTPARRVSGWRVSVTTSSTHRRPYCAARRMVSSADTANVRRPGGNGP